MAKIYQAKKLNIKKDRTIIKMLRMMIRSQAYIIEKQADSLMEKNQIIDNLISEVKLLSKKCSK